MPTQSHQESADPDFPAFEAFQPEPKRKQSPSRKSQAKNRRKNERHAEESAAAGSFKTQDQEITGRRTITSPSDPSAFGSQLDLASKLDPSLESVDGFDKAPPIKGSSKTTMEASRIPQHGYSHSLSNRRNLAGSPPARTSYTGSLSPPISPRLVHRNVVPQDQGFVGIGGFQGASPQQRHLHSAYSPNDPRVALPHMDQPHFYGAPDLHVGRMGRTQNTDAARRDFCAFDRIPIVSPGGEFTQCEVLLTSRSNNLDLFQLSRAKLNSINALRNLRGCVVDAKIIMGVEAGASHVDPEIYVVVILHGPATADNYPLGNETPGEDVDDFEATQSMMQALEVASSNEVQTTVEVYSFTSGSHVTTLFASPKLSHGSFVTPADDGLLASIGKLSIHVAGRYITVNSGSSGEVFIFRLANHSYADRRPNFTCIGKTWTARSVKARRSQSVSSRESVRTHDDDRRLGADDLPIVALNARFLATVSPGPSNGIGCHGQVLGADLGKIPGLSSHSPPESPSVTCRLDTPNEESLLNRVARDATQELVKGAKWVGSQGVAAWNYYWTKPGEDGRQASTGTATAVDNQAQFPPTHAHENASTRTKSGPALVSILDLECLAQSQHQKDAVALQPIAVFQLHAGCSAMSFSPLGTQLFTASGKGDVQQIWDLMRMVTGIVDSAPRENEGVGTPTIREIAKFTRITEARIIDVAWLHPSGGKFAIATDRGTVHTFELAPSAFHWPPLRRITQMNNVKTTGRPPIQSNDATHSSSSAFNAGLGSAFGMLSGSAQPLFSAVRGRATSPTSTVPNLGTIASTAGAGAKGSRAVAVGLNRSLTAAASGTVNSVRHFGENRINLPGPSKTTFARCMIWTGTSQDISLAVTASGIIRLHGIRPGGISRDGRQRPSAVGSKPVELAIPEYRQPDVTQGSLRATARARPRSGIQTSEPNPLSYAEIETHAPYQPFHTDRRVGFCVYDESSPNADPHHFDSNDAWAFGDDIPSTRVRSSPTTGHNDEREDGRLLSSEMENVVERHDNEGNEEIMVTTRRKKKKTIRHEDAAEDPEFFEDEMEVVDFAQRRV